MASVVQHAFHAACAALDDAVGARRESWVGVNVQLLLQRGNALALGLWRVGAEGSSAFKLIWNLEWIALAFGLGLWW